MNVDNYGNRLVFGTGFAGAGFDMSSYTTLTMTFTRPDATQLVVASPDVVLGGTNYTLPNGQVFNANQYATYIFVTGDVTVPGAWKVRLNYRQGSTISYTSNVANFVVGI